MRLRKAEKQDLSEVMEITKAVVPLMVASGNTQWSESYPDAARFEADVENGSLYVLETEGGDRWICGCGR